MKHIVSFVDLIRSILTKSINESRRVKNEKSIFVTAYRSLNGWPTILTLWWQNLTAKLRRMPNDKRATAINRAEEAISIILPVYKKDSFKVLMQCIGYFRRSIKRLSWVSSTLQSHERFFRWSKWFIRFSTAVFNNKSGM